MEPQNIWIQQASVRASETDFLNRWKPSAFFSVMQEGAANHAENLGVGYQAMLEHGLIWVLSRLKIRFYDYPKVYTPIQVQTWPRPIQQKIFFTRDYQVTGPQGELYANATSAWLLMDIHARRMAFPNKLPGALPYNNGLFALNESLEKIAPLENPALHTEVQASYSVVDLMGHVNNTRYIDWICDCFSFDFQKSHTLAWLQINYNNEVLPGENINLTAGERDPGSGIWVVAGSHPDGARAFDAETGWEPVR